MAFAPCSSQVHRSILIIFDYAMVYLCTSVHTLLFTPCRSHPALHRCTAPSWSFSTMRWSTSVSLFIPSSSHHTVHTLLFTGTPFHPDWFRLCDGLLVTSVSLFIPFSSHHTVHTLLFAGTPLHPDRFRLRDGLLMFFCSHPPLHTLPFIPCSSQVHRSILIGFDYAMVWGTSVKHTPQRVGLAHVRSYISIYVYLHR